MKTLFSFLTVAPILLFSTNNNPQINHAKAETFNVQGNCNTCKKNIETAAYVRKASSVVWNENSKTAQIIYDSTLTTADAILKKIALAGYDNQGYLAPDAAYDKLNACCQYERQKLSKSISQLAKVNTHSSHQVLQDSTQKPESNNELTGVYSAYFDLKDALIKTDGNSAAAKAKVLYKAVDAVPMEKLSDTQHLAWMKYMKDISYNAEHIKGTTEIEHQREHFTKLSAAMYELMKVIKADYQVYYDHCPMYNNGKGGDWLSKESDIKNPYYGSQMLSCGNTKEVIK